MTARCGGVEFMLILPHTSATQAHELIDRLRTELADTLLTGATPAFTASFGISDTSMRPRFEQLLKSADEALYCAKEAGRDRAIIGTVNAGKEGNARRTVEHPAVADLTAISRQA